MQEDNPFEYYDGKLGVRLSFLVVDSKKCQANENSISVISYDAIEGRMRRKTSKEKRLRKACLCNEALILHSSIDRAWKDMLTLKFGNPREQVTASFFAEHYLVDREAQEFYITHRYGDRNEHRLDTKLVQEYTYNASVLNTVLIIKRERAAYVKANGEKNLNMWQSLSNDVNAFREVPHTLPSSVDGLRKKAAKYIKGLKESKEAAYTSLISGKLLNKNASVTRAHNAQLAIIKKLRAKHTNLDAQFIADLYNTMAKEMGWKTITRQTVMNVAPDTDHVVFVGRNGTRKLVDNKLMQVKRKAASSSMLYWTLDGWDVELFYQQTAVDKNGKRTTTYLNRLTAVMVVDAHNKYPIGYAIGTHETPELINQAVQNAIRHTQELFGDMYMPYQLQSDNYARKKMMPTYTAVTTHYTPAQVGNAKSKIIEPYFGYFNKTYCKLHNNWSGHNLVSGSKSQPNVEYLNKIKKTFPDRQGCEAQIREFIEMDRRKRFDAFAKGWDKTPDKYRQVMSPESYLLTFGSVTGETNRLRGDGLVLTIDGIKHTYDSWEPAFRNHSHKEWAVRFDRHDLSTALAVSTDGSQRFMLESKHIQAMALADRVDGDAEQLTRVQQYNKAQIQNIIEQRAQIDDTVDKFFYDHPQLNDTMAKMLLTDSHGQHKNHKSAQRLEAAAAAGKIAQREERKTVKKQARTFADEQREFHKSKIDINQYLPQS